MGNLEDAAAPSAAFLDDYCSDCRNFADFGQKSLLLNALRKISLC